MPQITLRVTEALARSVKAAAAASGRSLNAWATAVLEAVVDPETAGSEAERVRERLRRAALLAEPTARVKRPKPEELARARRRAAQGTMLSDLISEGRR